MPSKVSAHFFLQTDNDITIPVYHPIVGHILQNYVLLLFMAVREEPLGTFGYFLKAQVVLRSNSKPTFLRTAFQFPRRNYTPPSVSPRALYHPYQGLETHGSYVSHLWSPRGQHCPVQFCTRRAWIDETSSTVNLLWTACLKAGHVWLGVWALLRNCKDLSTVPVGKHRSMSE